LSDEQTNKQTVNCIHKVNGSNNTDWQNYVSNKIENLTFFAKTIFHFLSLGNLIHRFQIFKFEMKTEKTRKWNKNKEKKIKIDLKNEEKWKNKDEETKKNGKNKEKKRNTETEKKRFFFDQSRKVERVALSHIGNSEEEKKV